VTDTALAAQKAFRRLVFITRDDLLAARWWHEGMADAATLSPDRRTALKFLVGMGGLLGAGLLLRAGCNALGDPAINDESDRFDNRYLARLPGADRMEALGIKRVLYVTASPESHELDDLNDDFVALKNKAIDVKMIALSDFAPAPTALLQDNHLPPTDPTYYYGGHPYGHVYFWSSYHWYSPGYTGRAWTGSLPRSVSTGRSFAPVSRPTIFSSRTVGGLAGVGKQKPSGFGRASYRAGGGGFGRSGSFGRTSFSGSG